MVIKLYYQISHALSTNTAPRSQNNLHNINFNCLVNSLKNNRHSPQTRTFQLWRRLNFSSEKAQLENSQLVHVVGRCQALD